MYEPIATFLIFAFFALVIYLMFRDTRIDGHSYPTYGFFNEDQNRDKGIYYSASIWKLLLCMLTLWTVIIPIYILACTIMIPRFKLAPKSK